MNKDPFKEYIRESEPDKRDKGYAWHTAIGLQAVDGLKTSEYLVRTAVRNIEGEISFEEANALIDNYYPKKANSGDTKANIEAEKANIEKTFNPKTAAHVIKLLETFGFEGDVVINGPANVKEKYKEMVMKVAEGLERR